MRHKPRGVIAFTGTMTRKRSEMAQMAIEAGFSVVDYVNHTVTYLVKGKAVGWNPVSTKETAAQRLGIPIISEGDFLDLIDLIDLFQSKKTEARKVIDERVDTEALRAYFR